MKCPQPRHTGPRVERLVSDNEAFQVQGIRDLSPTFRTRAQGERWLREQLAKLPSALRPRERTCLRCRETFLSEGFHNRLCAHCRSMTADDALPTVSLAAGTGKIRRAARG